jgi:hypothetical protein
MSPRLIRTWQPHLTWHAHDVCLAVSTPDALGCEQWWCCAIGHDPTIRLLQNLEIVEKVKAVAARHDCTPGQVALAWLHAQVTCARASLPRMAAAQS